VLRVLPPLALRRLPKPLLTHRQTQEKVAHFQIREVRAGLAVTRFQHSPHKGKADVLFNESQQMSLRYLIFQPEVVEQPLPSGRVVPS